MSTPATVGINDDFTSGQSGITMGTTNHEATRWVQVVDGLVIQILFGDNGLDDMLHQVRRNLFVGDIFGVLCRNDHGVDTLGDWHTIHQFVFTGDLGLTIGADPLAGTVLTDFG